MKNYSKILITKYYVDEDDLYHRLDGPAVEKSDGTKYWYQNGNIHREDGPAIEYANGSKCWLQNGKYHRDDGPAAEYTNGDKEWWYNGDLIGSSDEGFSEEKFNQWKKLKIFL